MNIIPAILEKDFSQIKNKLVFLKDIKEKYGLNFGVVQIDLCDGKFVENTTWLPNISEQKDLEFLSSLKSYFDIEYHLMCRDMLQAFLQVKVLNPKRVVIHIDEILFSEDVSKIIEEAEKSFIKLIISARLSFLEKNKEEIALFLSKNINFDLQVMGEENIGRQGQEFDNKCLDLLKFFRAKFSKDELYIQVDGGINKNSIEKVENIGVDGVVVGSFLMKDLEEIKFVSNYKSLQY